MAVVEVVVGGGRVLCGGGAAVVVVVFAKAEVVIVEGGFVPFAVAFVDAVGGGNPVVRGSTPAAVAAVVFLRWSGALLLPGPTLSRSQ